MGTAGSTQQTWNLINGGRSGLYDRDRSLDRLNMYTGPVAKETTPVVTIPEAPKIPVGALTLTSAGSTSYPSMSSNVNPNTGKPWTDDELASIVAGDSGTATDSTFYDGGAGLPSWAVSAARSGLGVGGAFMGVPGPLTSITGGVIGAALGEEGLNEHTAANAGINTLLSLNPITGIANTAGKGIAGLLGKEYDIANAIGEATGTYGLRSPNSLNLEMFDNNSDSAFAGFNQRTAAEIARQEALNRAEHLAIADEYQKQQDAAVEARRQAAARQAAELAAYQAEAAKQAARQKSLSLWSQGQVSEPVRSAMQSQFSNSNSPLAQMVALSNSNDFDSGSAYGITGHGPWSSSSSSSSSSSYSNPTNSAGMSYSGVGSSPSSGMGGGYSDSSDSGE